MYISEEFLTADFENAEVHLQKMLKNALKTLTAMYNADVDINYYDILETYKIVHDFCVAHNIPVDKLAAGKNPTTSHAFYTALNTFYTDYILSKTDLYGSLFAKKLYTFTDKEHETIQMKINSLRDKISECTDIDEKHKERILKKLEDMQKMLHKKMSTFDTFLGGMVSIANTLGRSAIEAKPFLDDVKDILDITLNATSRSENLPDNKQITTTDLLQITE